MSTGTEQVMVHHTRRANPRHTGRRASRARGRSRTSSFQTSSLGLTFGRLFLRPLFTFGCGFCRLFTFGCGFCRLWRGVSCRRLVPRITVITEPGKLGRVRAFAGARSDVVVDAVPARRAVPSRTAGASARRTCRHRTATAHEQACGRAGAVLCATGDYMGKGVVRAATRGPCGVHVA